jgi:hypothetical protein
MYRIRCYTLFDITKTGVLNRKPPSNSSVEFIKDWEHKRNTQCNFDTIIQVVSLRAQPEEITNTKKHEVEFKESEKFGFLFENEEKQNYWSFDFSILQGKVFDDGVNELGFLFQDCDGVPMIQVQTQWDKLPGFLDVTPELRNIHFEILRDE